MQGNLSGGKRYQSFPMEVPPLLAIADQPADVPVLVVAPPRKRQRIPRLPPVVENVEPDDTELFTPEQVVNTNRCEARVWGAGWGGPVPEEKGGVPFLWHAQRRWGTFPRCCGWTHSTQQAEVFSHLSSHTWAPPVAVDYF